MLVPRLQFTKPQSLPAQTTRDSYYPKDARLKLQLRNVQVTPMQIQSAVTSSTSASGPKYPPCKHLNASNTLMGPTPTPAAATNQPKNRFEIGADNMAPKFLYSQLGGMEGRWAWKHSWLKPGNEAGKSMQGYKGRKIKMYRPKRRWSQTVRGLQKRDAKGDST